MPRFGAKFKILLALFVVNISCEDVKKGDEELVIRISGGPLEAQLLAEETGHFFRGPVRGFEDTYILMPMRDVYEIPTKRNFKRKSIDDDHRVLWVEKQEIKKRQKRDFVTVDPADIPIARDKRINDNDNQDNNNKTQNNNNRFKRQSISFKLDNTFNDELWPQQWYLKDTRTRLDLPKLDLNVLPVYRAGITGKGVRISVLDDGIEYNHEDLRHNYDPEISFDCNQDDADPLPRYEISKSNSHGTRCAGEIAMLANNKKCGVGVAFNSKIGGVKMLDGIVTDRIEGTALGYARHLVDIYSASWGPHDDGQTVDGPGRLAREAMEKGILEGRNGKGAIYVWASGNGGKKDDNCNCDGYLSSPYTISIGSASQKGEFPWYGEACSNTLAVTYSSGAYKDQMIATTDLNNECTIKHTGTSASAPLAAGIIALALEVNPSLTWRDVQHLIIWTSEVSPLSDNTGWQKNAAGFFFNNKFGFGLMNADGLVKAAYNWTNVPPKRICHINSINNNNNNLSISYEKEANIVFNVNVKNCNINYLEHVELRTNIEYSSRGSLEIYLTSPEGTVVQILSPRKFDKSAKGFKNWSFMSVMTWAENPLGIWKVSILDKNGPNEYFGNIGETTLILHGTENIPEYLEYGKRNYNKNYNRIYSRKYSNNDIYDYYDNLGNENYLKMLLNNV